MPTEGPFCDTLSSDSDGFTMYEERWIYDSSKQMKEVGKGLLVHVYERG